MHIVTGNTVHIETSAQWEFIINIIVDIEIIIDDTIGSNEYNGGLTI